MLKWDHLKSQCIIQVVTCLMLIICQRWDISTFAVWHFTTVVWREPWKGLQWCLHQMITHQSMYKLKSSSQVAQETINSPVKAKTTTARPPAADTRLSEGEEYFEKKEREMSHRAQAQPYSRCIYYLLLWHFYCEEVQVAPDSPEQKKYFSLEAAKLADVVKHLEGYKLVLSNWCTLMTWCVDMMIITEDQWTTQIYLLMFQSRLTSSNLFLDVSFTSS